MYQSEIDLPVFQDFSADSDPRAKANHNSLSNNVTATTLKSKIKSKFRQSGEISAERVHIQTHKGVVLLSGFISSKKHKAMAEKLTLSVKGVKNVKNALTTFDEANTSATL